MFVPVGGDEDGLSEGIADVVDGGFVVVQYGVHEVYTDGTVWVSFSDEERPVETKVPCGDDEGVVDGWAVVNVVACRSP